MAFAFLSKMQFFVDVFIVDFGVHFIKISDLLGL